METRQPKEKAIMSAPIEPFDDFVLVEIAQQKMTKGGILVPDTANLELPRRGKVVAVGPGKVNERATTLTRWPMNCKVGDEVVFSEHSGIDQEIDGVQYKMIQDGYICGRATPAE